MVDEQNAVEMVDLVLENGGEQALGQDFALLPLAVKRAGAHGRWPLDLGVIFRNRKAALLVGRAVLGRPHDLGIDEHLGVGSFFLLGGVDHQKTDRFGDLNGRESDARRVVHGLDHVIDQAAQIIVDALDLFTDEAQLRVGQNDDRSEGHAGLFAGEASGLIIGWTGAVKRVLILFHSSAPVPPELTIPAAPIAVVDGMPVSLTEALGAALALLAALTALSVIALWRAGAARRRERRAADERQQAIEARFAQLAQSSAELSGRIGGMSEWLGSRQTDLARLVADRLDSVGARLGAGLESQAQTTGESLGKLNERLAVIDAAQSRLSEMTREVVSLKDILSNKQSRGAFGQGRMEAIVRDGLPAGAYEFQFTLSNRARPDCVIRLPGDTRLLAIDAKFPLEGFTALRAARDEETRKIAQARVRADVGKHVKDIAERYLLPGETQDVALMFVPSEAIYSDLVEHFDDLAQKAHRARVVIVSPTLMMMAISVAQAILRDARMRDEAHEIQAEVGKLMKDVRLLVERAGKLETHFRQAQDDLAGLGLASARVARRGERIEAMDFSQQGDAPAPDILRLARGAE